MKIFYPILISVCAAWLCTSCAPAAQPEMKTAAVLLGNPDYPAIAYSGHRGLTRDIQPTPAELKEDMRILSAMGIRFIRTYNVYLAEVPNLLEVIRQLRDEDPSFEMYVMLGAWIDCKNAWTDLPPDHTRESERNAVEIDRAVSLAKQYPDIVKVIAVGNEAMVKWAAAYYVEPWVILKWVNHLQDLKARGELPSDLWITSSDNFASWGGGDTSYHVAALDSLIHAVDFISMHTYPMHDTHYNPGFWGVRDEEAELTDQQKIEAAMLRARDYAISQYEGVVSYMHSLGADKPVHIGETGWASISDGFYGDTGSRAVDEYKAAMYYKLTREWTQEAGISCFYFEAFDEQWKDASNPLGSENHFGLINLKSQAKHALWEHVDQGTFDGLTRDGLKITKTYDGNLEVLMQEVMVPPSEAEILASREDDK